MNQRPDHGPHRPREPRVSVIVPTRNEARNLEVVLPAIAAVRPAVHEVLVVDGNSKDGTIETAQRVLPDVRIVRQTRKGKGNAMACGFAAASGDVLVMFDADGSADPQEIPRFVRALVEGADFAKGSRFTRGGGSDDITFLRKGGNAGLNLVANTLFGTRYTDLCYGYNAFWVDILPDLELPPVDLPRHPDDGMYWGDGFEIETVLNCRVAAAGLTITEVPSVEKQRMFGETNLRTFADGSRVLRTLAAERRRVGRDERGSLAPEMPAAVVPPAGHPAPPPVAAGRANGYGSNGQPVNGHSGNGHPAPGVPAVPSGSAGGPSAAATGRPAPGTSGSGAPMPAAQRPHAPSPTPRAGRDREVRAPGDERAARTPAASGQDGAPRADQVGVRYAWGEEAS
ncbi:glycosyltransferase [Pseudonocardia nantongensis]|uniref:glycosyltransferase family 2 protein n=1 Tax=Pseudonocardia nantongensis TaxID=1181885 RepID=UPI00397B6825